MAANYGNLGKMKYLRNFVLYTIDLLFVELGFFVRWSLVTWLERYQWDK